MTDILQIPSTTRSGVKYNLTIDVDNNRVKCSCTGFQSHGYCKHIRMYKTLINKKIYGDPFTQKVIQSFNNCYDFVVKLCEQFPECKGDYDELDDVSKAVLDALNKHYGTETIHRTYRLAVKNGEILEPIQHQIRKEKTETVMHDINKWSKNNFIGFKTNQTSIDGDGIEK